MPTRLDRALALGINGNPFAALGPHDTRAGRIIRAFLPSATKVELLRRPGGASRRTTAACSKTLSKKRTLSVPDLQAIERTEDPYAFGLLLGESDLFLFNEGRHFELGKCLGAQSLTVDGVSGVRFAVRAPSGL